MNIFLGNSKKINTMVVPRNQFGIATQAFAKLRYCDAFNVSTGLGLIDTFQINMNSIFDPYAGVGGHQPRLHDQWQAMYNFYKVYAVQISYRYINRTSTVAQVYMYARDDASTLGSLNDLCELTGVGKATNADKQQLMGKRFWRIRNILNPARFKDNDCAAAFGANPVVLAICNIAIVNNEPGGGNALDGHLEFFITYYCKFWDKKFASGS